MMCCLDVLHAGHAVGGGAAACDDDGVMQAMVVGMHAKWCVCPLVGPPAGCRPGAKAINAALIQLFCFDLTVILRHISFETAAATSRTSVFQLVCQHTPQNTQVWFLGAFLPPRSQRAHRSALSGGMPKSPTRSAILQCDEHAHSAH